MSPRKLSELIEAARFPSLEHLAVAGFSSLQPQERLTVVEAAEKYVRIGDGSGLGQRWSAAKTPYLVEPMNTLTSLDYTGLIFVGPARTGKTLMSLGWLAHTVICDPADMMYVHMDRENARKWSKGDLGRFLQASPDVRKHQLVTRRDDNTFDKSFDSGMRFLLTYPTASNLSGITVPRLFLIDYERGDDDIDGEGNKYDLAAMRATTAKRFGMTAAEASPNPNKEITDPKWRPSTPHEAPPIRGIFSLYNRGDRRRWYTACPFCNVAFEMDFPLLRHADSEDIMECKETTHMVCPHCEGKMFPHQKEELNANSKWVKDGQIWLPEIGEIVDRPGMKAARSSIASFHLKGPAAAFQDWGNLVEKYLRAEREFEETRDDSALRKTVTTDQGRHYIPASRLSDRTVEDLQNKAEDWGSSAEAPTVPEGTRILIATFDVQKDSFVCQVTGITDQKDFVVIDNFKLRLAYRTNAAGERLPIRPAAYAEDWDVLVDELLYRSYPLADGSGRRMVVHMVAGDSGGEEGVTAQAYALWRRIRDRGDGSHRRFALVKGEHSKSAPRAFTARPDSKQKNKQAIARGDVPVIFMNSTPLKDMVAVMMSRRVESKPEANGGGMLRYPNWMPHWFYTQLTTEIRTALKWDNPRQRRNEVFDLTYYAVGAAIRPPEIDSPYAVINLEKISFDENCPVWAAPWDENANVFTPEPTEDGEAEDMSRAPRPEKRKRPSIAEIANRLA